MRNQFPGACTRSGEPILGGADLDADDRRLIAAAYPKRSRSAAPAPPAFAEVRRALGDLLAC